MIRAPFSWPAMSPLERRGIRLGRPVPSLLVAGPVLPDPKKTPPRRIASPCRSPSFSASAPAAVIGVLLAASSTAGHAGAPAVLISNVSSLRAGTAASPSRARQPCLVACPAMAMPGLVRPCRRRLVIAACARCRASRRLLKFASSVSRRWARIADCRPTFGGRGPVLFTVFALPMRSTGHRAAACRRFNVRASGSSGPPGSMPAPLMSGLPCASPTGRACLVLPVSFLFRLAILMLSGCASGPPRPRPCKEEWKRPPPTSPGSVEARFRASGRRVPEACIQFSRTSWLSGHDRTC